MRGLLERAQLLVHKRGGARGLSSVPESERDEESGISAEERSELLAQIEGLFTERRPIEVAEKNKARSGARFPIAVNVSAIAVLAVAIIVISQLSNATSGQATSGRGNYLTTEGLVVQRVKQQAAEQVGATEARIASIKKELDRLRAGSPSTGGSASSAREKQLERELATLQSSTTNRLTALKNQQQQQLFLIRQLQSIYQNVQADVAGAKFDSAISNLGAAQHLLTTVTASSNASLAAAAPALIAGNDVLRATLLYAQAETAAAHSTTLPAQIAAINKLVDQGDLQYKAGDLAAARDSYMQAITSLASVSRAYDRLTAMTKDSYDRQTAQLAARIRSLESQVSTLDAAVREKDRTIAAERNRLAAANTRIAGQQRAIEEGKLEVQKRSSELATVVNSTLNAIHSASQPKALAQLGSDSSVVDLLRTKVEIRKLAESKSARETYPDLYKQLDPFFQGYAQTYSDQGRSAALKQVASALNDVIVALNLHIPVAVPNSSARTGRLESNGAPSQLSFADPISSYLADVNQALDRIAAMN